MYQSISADSVAAFAETLARRLRGPYLLSALEVAQVAMSELGGCIRRVRQRLQHTLEWCETGDYPGLMLDSTQAEQSAAWIYRPPGSPHTSAAEFHRAHARRIQFIAYELRLLACLRRGLVKAAHGAAASARRLELQNISNMQNRQLALIGAEYRVNRVQSDLHQRKRKASQVRQDTRRALIDAQRMGWIVEFVTIRLPDSCQPHLHRRLWGLAGAPDAAKGADALRTIHAYAVPARAARTIIGGLWRIDTHKTSGQVHLHAMVAHRDVTAQARYHQRLYQRFEYEAHRRGWRSLPVVGAFGIGVAPHDREIVIKPLNGPHDIARVSSYIARGLDAEIDLTPGRRYSCFGFLRSGASHTPASLLPSRRRHAGFICIKNYRDPQEVICSTPPPAVISSSWLRPHARGPPHTETRHPPD